MVDVFGKDGKHSRTVPLPMNIPVEVEMIVEILI